MLMLAALKIVSQVSTGLLKQTHRPRLDPCMGAKNGGSDNPVINPTTEGQTHNPRPGRTDQTTHELAHQIHTFFMMRVGWVFG